MSRYEVVAINAQRYCVIVGWDNPLQTFFGQVFDLTLDEDEACVYWLGTYPGHVLSVSALKQAISAYANLPADTLTHLERDQAAATPPSRLQKKMWSIIPLPDGSVFSHR